MNLIKNQKLTYYKLFRYDTDLPTLLTKEQLLILPTVLQRKYKPVDVSFALPEFSTMNIF